MAGRLKEIFPRTTWVMDQFAYAGERGKNKYGNYTFDLENRRVQIDGKRFAFLYLTVPIEPISKLGLSYQDND